MTLIVGIDPGLHGAVALYGTDARDVLDVWDMPTLKLGKGSGNKTVLDEPAYRSLMGSLALTRPSLVIIEEVSASPQQGVVSAFTFGETYGLQRGLTHLLGANCRLERVRPSTWKKAMKVGKEADDILRAATERWPSRGDMWKTSRGRICHDRCEAALLAAYGHQLLGAGK